MNFRQVLNTFQIILEYKRNERKLCFDTKTMKQYQLKRLKKVVTKAYKNIPFYKKKWDEAGFDPKMIKTLDDINKIPILTKDELRSEYHTNLDTTKWKKGRWFATTGSTGAYVNLFHPMKKVHQELSIMSPMFVSKVYKKKITKGLLFLVIEDDSYEAMGGFEAPNPRIKFEDVFTPLDEMVKIIREFKPDIMVTYPSRLKELMTYMEEQRIFDVRIPVITTSGEKLDEETRVRAFSLFVSDIYEGYAATEIGVVALEGPDYKGLKNIEFKNYLEICDDFGNSLGNEEVGNIVVTDLDNEVMPVIRYSGLGDMASFKDRELGLLNPICGRKIDIVKSPKGRTIHPFKLTLEVQKVDGINMYQIQQRNINDLDVLVVPKKDACHTTIVDEVDQYMNSVLDQELNINVHMVNEIPRKNNSHKHATVVSYLQ